MPEMSFQLAKETALGHIGRLTANGCDARTRQVVDALERLIELAAQVEQTKAVNADLRRRLAEAERYGPVRFLSAL
jgi:hypothetical protein